MRGAEETSLRLQNLVPLIRPGLPKTTKNVVKGRSLSLFLSLLLLTFWSLCKSAVKD